MQGVIHLTPEMILVLGLVVFTVLMLALEWIRSDVTAILVLTVIAVSGLLPAKQVFEGFANPGVQAILAIMIMGVGLDRTGALNAVATIILKAAQGAQWRLLLVINSVTTVLSSIIPSQALAALMIPVASRVSSRSKVPLSKILLPMACVILTGTNTTLIANTPLIILNGLIESSNRNLPPGANTIPEFGMFTVTPIGVVLALMGIGFFWLFADRLFKNVGEDTTTKTPRRTENYFAETYGIDGDVQELTVSADSPLVGMSIAEAEALPGAPLILALKTGNESRLSPPADTMIWVGTVLGVMGSRDDVGAFASAQQCRVTPRPRQLAEMFNAARAGISEAVVPPSSRFIKQSVGDLHLRKRYGISVLAVNRGDQVFREDVRSVSLRGGDTLVLHSAWQDLAQPREEHDIVVVTDVPQEEARPGKWKEALFFFLLAKFLALTELLPLQIAFWVGAAGMLATGVITPNESYRSINWKTIFITACLMPLGWTMDRTGAGSWLGQELMLHIGSLPQWAIQASVAILALALSQVMQNVGATVVMVPIAINIALATGGNPTAYIMITAMSVSNTFLISSAHPALTMVAGPGGYRGKDFLRVGLPLTAAYLITTVVGADLLYRSF